MNAHLEETLFYNPKKPNIDELFSKFKITNYAYNKIQTYADRITALYGEPIELIGFITSPIDKFDGIAYNAVLALDQTVAGSKCDQNSFESYHKTEEKIEENGNKITGWWHSHGNHYLVPSQKDMGYFKVMVREKAEDSLLELEPNVKLFGNLPYSYELNEKNNLKILKIKSNDSLFKNVELTLDDFVLEEKFKVRNIKLVTFRGLPYCQMYIVNSKKEKPYRSFGIIDLDDKFIHKENMPFDFLDIYDNKKIDINKIDEEIKNEVYVDEILMKDIVEKKSSKKIVVEKEIESEEKGFTDEEVSREEKLREIKEETALDLIEKYSKKSMAEDFPKIRKENISLEDEETSAKERTSLGSKIRKFFFRK